MEKSEVSTLAIALVIFVIIAAILVGVYCSIKAEFLPVIEDTVLILLALAVDVLYLVAGGLILLGSVLMAVRYTKAKLRAPLQPVEFAPHARYLTVGLEILIGAEIINTARTRTWEGFLLLSLTIMTRGLIGLILHIERKWGERE